MFYLMMFYMILLVIYLFALFIYYYINKLIMYIELELFNNFSIKLEMLILLDWVSLLFISIVLLISLMVIFYSFDYMSSDENLVRFIGLVFMFVLSMLMMILSPNMISILLGWDGLGLVSYCLVIYYQGWSSINSGMVTVLINRLGDILILMSVSLMLVCGSWNFMFFDNMNYLIYFMLVLVSFTKSAQVPFSSWLPLAMAAPTPVSSLVHSSTLVTAGVYLLIRLNYLLFNSLIIYFIMIISLITMFLSGLGANFENDFKKIIALSTLSQLGLMMFSLSFKMLEISLFHLLMHAMFKSLLFMCAGMIIHSMEDNQDIRYISMSLYNLPMVSVMFNCASLSLCGIPFLSGFFSKDLILEMYLMGGVNKLILTILFISLGFTIMYTFRLMYYSFIKVPQLVIYFKYWSFKGWMGGSMYLLFFFSVVKGLILSWLLFSVKNLIFLTVKFKLMIYFFMLIGMSIGLIFPKLFWSRLILINMNKFNIFFSMLWFMPMLYSGWVNKIFLFSEKLIFKMDLGWVEYFWGGWNKEILISMFKLDYFWKNYYYVLILLMIELLILLY